MKYILVFIGNFIFWYLMFAYVNMSFNPNDFTIKVCCSDEFVSSLSLQVLLTIGTSFINVAYIQANE